MCEPATIATVGVIAAGAGVQAFGQYEAGKANSQIAKNNAQVAGWQASAATQQGAYDAASVMQKARRLNATGLAAAASNGIDPTSGSVGNIFMSNAATAAQDAARAKADAALKAWGYKNEQQDFLAQSKIAKRAGIIGAIGTGLSGLGAAAGAGAGMYGAMRAPVPA